MKHSIEDVLKRYIITENGNVISLISGKKLKPHYVGGYLRISLVTNTGRKAFLVHRLVASVYLPQSVLLDEVNHINGIKDDNRLGNLEWSNRRKNTDHALINNLYKSGEKLPQSKLTRFDVETINNLLKSKTQKEVSAIMGVSRSTINRVALKKSWSKPSV
jgi:hypothetical protein